MTLWFGLTWASLAGSSWPKTVRPTRVKPYFPRDVEEASGMWGLFAGYIGVRLEDPSLADKTRDSETET